MSAGTVFRSVWEKLFALCPNAVRVGRWIYITPVEHVAVGLLLDRSSDPRIFRPTTLVAAMYEPGSAQTFGYGDRLAGRYELANPDVAGMVARNFADEFSSLRSAPANVLSLKLFIDSMDENRRSGRSLGAYSYAALGEFERAREHLSRRIEYLSKQKLQHSQLPEYRSFLDVLDEGPERIAEWLRAVERRNAQLRKIEQYWQPSPFPFETSKT